MLSIQTVIGANGRAAIFVLNTFKRLCLDSMGTSYSFTRSTRTQAGAARLAALEARLAEQVADLARTHNELAQVAWDSLIRPRSQSPPKHPAVRSGSGH